MNAHRFRRLRSKKSPWDVSEPRSRIAVGLRSCPRKWEKSISGCSEQ